MERLTKIYGASDDLIEIEGHISEELSVYDETVKFSCSDGTHGTISYNGEWTIEVIQEGLGFVKLVNSNDETPHTDELALGLTSYSDVLIVKDIEWLKIKKKTFKIGL